MELQAVDRNLQSSVIYLSLGQPAMVHVLPGASLKPIVMQKLLFMNKIISLGIRISRHLEVVLGLSI